jgi:hypothetical protein
MKKLISCCGLNCATCDARIATLNNDNELRKKTADKWKVAYQTSGLTPEMINCTGCREAGVKFSHCSTCEIRNCSKSKGYDTCSDCSDLNSCTIIAGIHNYMPEAKQNLLDLRL